MLQRYLNLPRAVHVLALGIFVNRVGTFVVPLLTLYLTTVLGLSDRFATQAIAAFGLGGVLAGQLGGYFADHVGRRPVMLVGMFGGAALLLVLGGVRAPIAIIIVVCLFSLVAESYRPAASAMIADVAGPAQRADAFGLQYALVNLAFGIAMPLGGWLSESIGYRWLFLLDAATSIIYGMIIVAYLPETLPGRRRQRAAYQPSRMPDASGVPNTPPSPPLSEGEPEPAKLSTEPELDSLSGRSSQRPAAAVADVPAPAESASQPVPFGAAVRRMLTDYPFVVFCVVLFLNGAVFLQTISTLPLHMKALGYSAHVYGNIIAINGLLIFALQIPVVSLISRFDRGLVVTAGLAVMGIGFGLMGMALSTWHFAVCVVIWTIGEIMFMPFCQAIAADLAPVDLRGQYMGAVSMSFSLAFMIAPLVGQWIRGESAAGGLRLWSACFVVSMVAAGMLLSIRGRVAARRTVPE